MEAHTTVHHEKLSWVQHEFRSAKLADVGKVKVIIDQEPLFKAKTTHAHTVTKNMRIIWALPFLI